MRLTVNKIVKCCIFIVNRSVNFILVGLKNNIRQLYLIPVCKKIPIQKLREIN